MENNNDNATGEMDFNRIAKHNITEMSDSDLEAHLANIRRRVRDKKTGKVKVKKTKKSDLEKLSPEDRLKLLKALGG